MTKLRFPILRFIAIASVLFCIAASAKAQDKVQLRLRLQPGQTFDQGFAMESKTSQTFPKQRMDMTMTMRIGMHCEVLSVNDETIKLKATYQSVAFDDSVSMGGKKAMAITYDSKKSPKDIPASAQSLAGLVGQSLTFTISSRGEVLNVEGAEAFIQRMIADIKSPAERAEVQKSLKQSFTSQGKQALGITVFPESPVAVGDSWKTQNTQQDQVLLLISAQYTLMASQNGVATLAVRSAVSPNTKTSPILTPKNPYHLSLSGTQNGVLHVDEQSGLARDFELHQRMSGRISMAMIKSTFGGKKSTTTVTNPRSWPIYMKSTMRGWIVQLPR